MATKIQMNLLNSSGSYEVLYPQTDYSNVLNTPTIPDTSNFVTSPVYINEGGTQATTASKAIYNLISGCSTATESDVSSSSYFPFYNSNTGYKMNFQELVKYIGVSGGPNTYSLSTSNTIVREGSFALALDMWVWYWHMSTTLVINNKEYTGGFEIFVKTGSSTQYYMMPIINDTKDTIQSWNINVATTSGTTTLETHSVTFS